MTIQGLENNNYLAQNDIWIIVNGFAKPPLYLEISATNSSVGTDLNKPIRSYSTTGNDFRLNISIPVRATFKPVDHSPLNTVNLIALLFKVTFTDGSTDQVVINKKFINGGRDKFGTYAWYMLNNEPLYTGPWLLWDGIPEYQPYRIAAAGDVELFTPTNIQRYPSRECEFHLIKFINSLGGVQYFAFEKMERKVKSNKGDHYKKIVYALSSDDFDTYRNQSDKSIELTTITRMEHQEVFEALVDGQAFWIRNPQSVGNAGEWTKLKMESSSSIQNNYDRTYENKVEFTIPNRF